MTAQTLDPPTRGAASQTPRPNALGTALLCEALLEHGVTTVFGYPGGAALPLYRELANYPTLRHVLVRHEENAALAADGYARATGFPGVCMVTSGPGATNLLTGIATAMMDSVPILAITGQVTTAAIGTQAFQEVDIVNMARPVVKAALQARRPEDVPGLIAEAFRVMMDGRPGPVLLDLPKDVQMNRTSAAPAPANGSAANGSAANGAAQSGLAQNGLANGHATVAVNVTTNGVMASHSNGAANGAVDTEVPAPVAPNLPAGHADLSDLEATLDRVAALIDRAERPVLAAGRGVLLAGGIETFRALAEHADLPTVTTLLGLGTLPESHPLAFGMAGMHGKVAGNLALHHADLVIGVGMRFDDRWVGRAKDFAPGATMVHVDVDPAAFGRVVRCDVPVLGDARTVLEGLLARVEPTRRPAWLARLQAWDAEHAGCLEPSGGEVLGSAEVIRALKQATGGAMTMVADVGQHQMFAALHTGFEEPNRFFTSGGLGTMGYAVPAAMGAKVAHPEDEVWAVVGDGGFQMSAPELTTLVTHGIDVKILIVNNACLGMVRQWQELFYDNVYSHSLLPHPDFAKLAEAHGCAGRTVTRRDELAEALAWARATPGPVVLEARVEVEETVLPMVPAGAATGELICVEGRVLPEV
ncbi:MAG: acetolactate synthase large subunit [Chloroflexi bacterium]|nr:acetolactate synthase large subunit [Chloroflexota bacterium]